MVLQQKSAAACCNKDMSVKPLTRYHELACKAMSFYCNVFHSKPQRYKASACSIKLMWRSAVKAFCDPEPLAAVQIHSLYTNQRRPNSGEGTLGSQHHASSSLIFVKLNIITLTSVRPSQSLSLVQTVCWDVIRLRTPESAPPPPTSSHLHKQVCPLTSV